MDIWSAGVVLYSMVYGTVPFKGSDMKGLHKQILKGEYSLPDSVSAQVRDLITRILSVDPSKRATTAEILTHPWMFPRTKVEVFTDSEIERINNEFFYGSRTQGRNTARSDATECFTEHNLETTNSLLRNNSTRSVVLAPFNSTFGSFETFGSFVRKNLYEKKAVL